MLIFWSVLFFIGIITLIYSMMEIAIYMHSVHYDRNIIIISILLILSIIMISVSIGVLAYLGE